MKTLRRSDDLLFLILKGIALTILFALGALILFFVFREHDKQALTTVAQRWVYPLGMAALLSALGTLCLGLLMRSRDDMGKPHSVFFYPVVAGVLALAGMCMAYAYLGLWPGGHKNRHDRGYASPVRAAAQRAAGYDPAWRQPALFL